jgi:hypothetical protein
MKKHSDFQKNRGEKHPENVRNDSEATPVATAQQYVVFLFPSVSYVLKAEKILKEKKVSHKLIPVPRHISADCGICLRVALDQQETVVGMLRGNVNWESMTML